MASAFAAVRSNIDTFRVVYYDNEQQAKDDVRTGKLQAADYYRWIFANEPEWEEFR